MLRQPCIHEPGCRRRHRCSCDPFLLASVLAARKRASALAHSFPLLHWPQPSSASHINSSWTRRRSHKGYIHGRKPRTRGKVRHSAEELGSGFIFCVYRKSLPAPPSAPRLKSNDPPTHRRADRAGPDEPKVRLRSGFGVSGPSPGQVERPQHQEPALRLIRVGFCKGVARSRMPPGTCNSYFSFMKSLPGCSRILMRCGVR
jgi:hypothetical protein